jgi:hypothetical protein
MTTPAEAVAKLRELIEYRLPASGNPLGAIVLSREVATALLQLLDAKKPLDESPPAGL